MAFARIAGHRIEYAWFGETNRNPPVVMLHEGLGSIAMWKDFPEKLAARTGHRVLAYSRVGYGRSDPITASRAPDFMHDEARIALPALREALGLERPVLFGHSDGGSIALIHAGDGRWPVAGVVVLAPHLFVEAFSLQSIRRAREVYETTDLRERLGRYHDDVDSAFRGWNDIWLDERFKSWNIEAEVARVECPILAIQGLDDEYGTMEQIDRIARLRPGVKLCKIESCGHSPHRDQPHEVLRVTAEFVSSLDLPGEGHPLPVAAS